MPKPTITVEQASAFIASSLLRFSAQTTQRLSELFVSRPSFLKRAFFSQVRNAERLEVLKLNCDMVIPHIAVAEYNLEHSDYWDRNNSDVVDSVRELSLRAITEAFEKEGCATIDADAFVREKTERFCIYCSITLVPNIGEEILKDHQLPSKMHADEIIRFLGRARISTYKKLWGEDQERTLQLQRPSIADLLAEVYRHWRGEDQLSDWNAIQFNLILENSLLELNLEITEACHSTEIA